MDLNEELNYHEDEKELFETIAKQYGYRINLVPKEKISEIADKYQRSETAIRTQIYEVGYRNRLQRR